MKLIKDLDLSYRAKVELSSIGIVHTSALYVLTEQQLLDRGVTLAVTSELKCYDFIQTK